MVMVVIGKNLSLFGIFQVGRICNSANKKAGLCFILLIFLAILQINTGNF
jgi:hypothetical protein